MTDTIVVRAQELTWRVVDREIVLLDLRTSRYFSINSSGSVLWRLLSQGTSRASLSGELRRTYGLDDAQAIGDVDRFVGELESHGLVETGRSLQSA